MFNRLLPFLFLFLGALLPLVLRPASLGSPRSIEEGTINAYGTAQGIAIQQQAVLTFCRAGNCTSSGPVGQGSLAFSNGWTAPFGVSSCAGPTALGIVAVTWDSSGRNLPAAVVTDLLSLQPGASDVGLTIAQFISSPNGSLIPLPACAPAGVAAIGDIVTL